jgi:hypothetical protein
MTLSLILVLCITISDRSLNTHSAFGPVTNPYGQGPPRSAGGSSGGSAAAVAANLCFAFVHPLLRLPISNTKVVHSEQTLVALYGSRLRIVV